jgi:hypothetical protein
MLLFRLSLVFAPAFLLATLSHAGSIIEFETIEHATGSPLSGTVKLSTQGGMTRLDIDSTSGDAGLIFDSGKGELVILDYEDKKYFVMTREQMDAMAVQVSDAMRKMEEALAAMPPEQRAMAEQMMKGRMPQQAPAQTQPKSTISKTGGSGSVAGLDCDNYEVSQAGRKIRDMCVTPWDEIDGGRESTDAMMAIADFFSGIRDAVTAAGGMTALDHQQEMFAHMKELNGFPVSSKSFNDDGVLTSESRLISNESVSLTPADFAPPAGFKKQEMF